MGTKLKGERPMKVLALVVLSMMTLGIAASGAQRKSEVKWDMEYFDKTWGIKFKSGKLESEKAEARVVLEFSKDLTAKEVAVLQNSLRPRVVGGVFFLFLDEDGVSLAKTHPTADGELTGKQGDAFRIVTQVPRKSLDKVHKVSARPTADDKK
jgi:hypothetical protein